MRSYLAAPRAVLRWYWPTAALGLLSPTLPSCTFPPEAPAAHVSALGQQFMLTQSGLTAQTISFGTMSNQIYGTAPFMVSATACSGLNGRFCIPLTTAVCKVSERR
jgi:hypothetical protein